MQVTHSHAEKTVRHWCMSLRSWLEFFRVLLYSEECGFCDVLRLYRTVQSNIQHVSLAFGASFPGPTGVLPWTPLGTFVHRPPLLHTPLLENSWLSPRQKRPP